jgi:hypothetical protein
MRLIASALCAAACASAPPLTDCACSAAAAEIFSLPSNASGAPAAQIRSVANASQCWSFA